MSMATIPLENWEAAQLEQSLSRRVQAGWGAFWVAGSRPQAPPPVPPIALTGGIPDPDSLPIDELIETSNLVLRREGQEALRYGGHQGYAGLREWLAAETSRREGLAVTADNFTITNGISGALINVCETFLDEGDVGLVEAPTFPGGAGAMQNCLSEVVGVEVDGDGLVPDALAQTIERLEGEGKRVKLLYTVPNFQNPTGTTLPLERRQAVVDICRRHNVLIAEDDAYGDIRFASERPPSLFALARGRGAVFMGSFSKTMATGLRIGWVLGDQPVIESLLRTRYDLGVSPWLQRTIHEFAASGLLERHVAKVNGIYRRKRDVMLDALEERCRRYATWNQPEGGYFLWLTLAETVDPAALQEAARRLGVAYVGGYAFHMDGSGHQSVRLAYSFVAEHDIPEAILRLGRALEEASGRPAT
jgi:DNA-binding transcriptional MocR family regulator